ncbi:MAG: CHAT domain-containing tetratricopeptide repeat protein [Bacteroidota bacterium]
MRRIILALILMILALAHVKGQDQGDCSKIIHDAVDAVGSMESLNTWFEEGYYLQVEKKVLASFPSSCPMSDTTLGDIYHKIGVNFINKHGDFLRAKYYYQKALNIRKDILDPLAPDIIKGYSNLADCYLELSVMGRGYYLDSAELMLKKSIALNKKRESPTLILANSYYYLSRIYRNKGDIENTILYLKSAINFLDQDPRTASDPYAPFDKAFMQGEISFVQSNFLNSPTLALRNAFEALDYFKVSPPQGEYENLTLGDIYYYAGIAYLQLDSIELAKSFLSKAIEYQEPFKQSSPSYIAPVYNTIGVLLNRENTFSEAIDILRQAIPLNLKERDFTKLASNYNNLGDSFFGLKELDSAIISYQAAINFCIPNYDEPDPLSNPDMRQEVTFDVPLLLNTLAAKGKALLALYQQTQEHKHLQAAYETFITSDQMVEIVRQSYLTQGSKAALVKEAKPMYEQAIKTCDQLYELTQEARYLHSAFNFSEHSKAVILLDAVRVTRILKEDLPAQTSKQIQNAQAKRLYFETQLARDISTPGLRDSIMKYRKQQADYYSAFLTASKNYHATQAIDQLNLKELVPSKEHALIEYFVGEENIYIFLLKSTQIHLYKSPKEADLNAWVSQLRNEIIQGVASRDVQISMHRLTEISHQLYQYLIAPLKPETLPHKLTIVRDDILELLPFELLIGEEIPMGTALEDIPYLLKSHIISYAFSANTKKIFEKNRVNPQKVALGLAPVDFANLSDFKLLTLPQTVKETQQIQEILNQGVEIYTGPQATSVRFLQQADEFAIIYIASHGILNNQDARLNGMAFFDKMLYTTDVYPLLLNAELVILRACESGAGELIPGEGIISLSHGFAQTGAKSVFSTQWVVPNATRFMGDFVRQLKEGSTKDEAMHLAKMEMVHSQHPYYWAAYEIRGDMDKVEAIAPQNSLIQNALLIALALTIISFIFVYSHSHSNKYRNKGR